MTAVVGPRRLVVTCFVASLALGSRWCGISNVSGFQCSSLPSVALRRHVVGGPKQSSRDALRSVSSGRTRLWSSSSPSSPPGGSAVLEVLSDECIGAVGVAHALGNELGLRTLKVEVLAAGLARRPERGRETLRRFGLPYPLVRASAMAAVDAADYPRMSEQKLKERGRSRNGGRPPPLPFGEDCKTVLTSAYRIAMALGADDSTSDGLFSSGDSKSKTTLVRSEHVLLAILGYNYGKPIDLEGLGPGYAVLRDVERVDDEGSNGKPLSAFELCQSLVEDLSRPFDPDVDGEGNDERRLNDAGGFAGSGGGRVLDEVGVDLTALASAGALDPVQGRNSEIRRALRTLGRRRKNNPCLVGEPGVGKTAVAEAIAQVLAGGNTKDGKVGGGNESKVGVGGRIKNMFGGGNGDESSSPEEEEESSSPFGSFELPACPTSLQGYRLIQIDLAALVAGTSNRGEFEQRVKNLIDEASSPTSKVILFLDEVHTLVGAGGSGGAGGLDAAQLFKPALARGQLRILGATTEAEYRRYIETDGALERRFQPLRVVEPTPEEALEVVRAVAPLYANHHSVNYTAAALEATVKLGDRYVADRRLPDKAIDLLDEAGSLVAFEEDEALINMGETNEADSTVGGAFVTEDTVARVVAERTGIPVGRLESDERKRLRDMEEVLGNKILGQAAAVGSVSRALRRARAGFRDPKRPVASFLFAGPTGTGKTELCRTLADQYFGTQTSLVRIDMSEYMDRFSTSRLVGAPPGYVGYEEGGQLTEAVRKAPHSLILLDEMEKAHPDVLNILLQVLDDGRLTDGKGRTVDFRSTIVVMTSNLGSQRLLNATAISTETGVGTVTSNQDATRRVRLEEARRAVLDDVSRVLRPELLNRLDEVVVFEPLSIESLQRISSDTLREMCDRAKAERDLDLTVGQDVINEVSSVGSGPYGARPIQRAARRYLEDTMSEALLREDRFVVPGDAVTVDLAGPGLVRITRTSSSFLGGGYSRPQDSIRIPVTVDGDSTSSPTDGERAKWQSLWDEGKDKDDSKDEGKDDPTLPTQNDGTWQ